MQGTRSDTELLHDDTVTREQTGEVANTLIAVGTQIGKVLIFDILGLLIHEIAMDVAVRSVEWIGDMSAPPVLPARGSSSPEQNPVINALIEEIGDIESVTNHPDAVRYKTQEQTNERTPISIPVASTSTNVTAKLLTPAAVSSPNSSQADSLYRLDAPREFDGTPAYTQTSVGNQALVAASGRDALDPGTRKQSRLGKVSITNSRRKHRACSAELSCRLSPGATSSQPDFFAASSTRRLSTRQDEDKNEAVHSVDGPAADSPRPYSKPRLEERGSPVWSNSFDQTQSTMLSQLATRGVAAKQARVSKRPKVLEYIRSVPVTETYSLRDPSSSLYSRPKSRVFRGRTEALDGGVDTMTSLLSSPTRDPRRSFSFSFEAELHDLEFPTERRHATAESKHEGISRLLKDNELLRHQLAGLRNDFQALKTVLLRSESSRRWQDCVS